MKMNLQKNLIIADNSYFWLMIKESLHIKLLMYVHQVITLNEITIEGTNFFLLMLNKKKITSLPELEGSAI